MVQEDLFTSVFKLVVTRVMNDPKVNFERAERRNSFSASVTFEDLAPRKKRVVQIRPMPMASSVLVNEGGHELVVTSPDQEEQLRAWNF